MNERSFNVKASCFPLTIYMGNIGRRRPRLSGGARAASPQSAAACRELALPAPQVAKYAFGKLPNATGWPACAPRPTERWTSNVGRWTFAS